MREHIMTPQIWPTHTSVKIAQKMEAHHDERQKIKLVRNIARTNLVWLPRKLAIILLLTIET